MNFDRIAPHYRWLEALTMGRALQACRVRWLAEVAHCRDVLIVGEGDGRFLRECARTLPDARLTVVDGSGAMIELAKSRWPNAAFVHAGLPEWKPEPDAFDLIVTHFFLDCFEPDEVEGMVASLARGARRDACWLVGDFQVPEEGMARLPAKALLWTAYRFFGFAAGVRARRLTPPDGFLEAAGFRLSKRWLARGGVLHSDVWKRETTPV